LAAQEALACSPPGAKPVPGQQASQAVLQVAEVRLQDAASVPGPPQVAPEAAQLGLPGAEPQEVEAEVQLQDAASGPGRSQVVPEAALTGLADAEPVPPQAPS